MTDRVPLSGLDAQGIATGAEIFWNLTTAPLVEHSVRRGEGMLAKEGPLVVRTGQHTGRAAKDRFIVRNATTDETVWWGKTNKPMDLDAFDRLYEDFKLALADKEILFAADLFNEGLDIPSVDQLVSALRSYRGALLVVSHDDAFLARLGLDATLALDAGGRLTETAAG